ncbi:hypothetical protein B296_00042735, partial [Ensete ventricosum]
EVVRALFHEKCDGYKGLQSRAGSRVSIGFLCTILEIQNTGYSEGICPWEVVQAWFYEKNVTIINIVQCRARSRVSISFSRTIFEIQNTSHSHGKSYEQGFTKKYDEHNVCAKLRAKSSFDRFFISMAPAFRSIFREPSQKFKILAIPNVFAHGKSYEHHFVTKRNGHKVCTKLRVKSPFDRFFVQRLGNSQRICPWEVVRARFCEKMGWS